MAQDHLLWKNDIKHRFSPTSLTDAVDGSGFIATAIIASVTTISKWKMTQWDAYFDLRNTLLGVSEFDGIGILPKATATELTALTGIKDGQGALNITENREDRCMGAAWVSSAGVGTMSPSAYGNMFEDSSSGSAMDAATKRWITAGAGVFDGSGLVTFLNHADGDRLVIGTAGGGDYMVIASCGQTNSGSNRTAMTVHVNDSESTVVKDDQNASAAEHRPLVANGILTLAGDDYLTLHVADPDTPANEIKVFDCHLTIQRVS